VKSIILSAAVLLSLVSENNALASNPEEHDPAQVTIGERLFLEARFAQAYYARPKMADPALSKTITVNGALKSPFAGKTMSCRACHMVDEHKDTPAAGMRSYSDYAKRPPVPNRGDAAYTSGRNSMSMVNISLPYQFQKDQGAVFHYDGEFNSMEDLVRATYTGRNFGWLVGEEMLAIEHIAKIIRKDDGNGELAQEFGGKYSTLLKGTSKTLPEKFALPIEYRIDVNQASDKEIFNAVAKLVSAYVTNLTYQVDEKGNYIGSPYDAFLKKNNLPSRTKKNESAKLYSARLLKAVNKLKQPKFITANENTFASHKQEFVFSKKELQGMKLFFKKGTKNATGGNCVSCHTAPHFSDFGFHNTGLVQQNYDSLHGNGAFNKLIIPGLIERSKNHNKFLPATVKHPTANSRFRSIATKDKPGYTDLGLWNVFANPDMPAPQKKLTTIICKQNKTSANKPCNTTALLDKTIAAFKTPVLRDLGHSNPYMHNGQFDNLQQIVQFYITSSAQAKNNNLRNSESPLREINLSANDVDPLVAFLKSLNEDYD
jgi:cytochrome c peroxidase